MEVFPICSKGSLFAIQWKFYKEKGYDMRIGAVRYKGKYVLFFDTSSLNFTRVTSSSWKGLMLMTIVEDLILSNRIEKELLERIFRCLIQVPARKSKLFEKCYDIWVLSSNDKEAYRSIAKYLTEEGYKI